MCTQNSSKGGTQWWLTASLEASQSWITLIRTQPVSTIRDGDSCWPVSRLAAKFNQSGPAMQAFKGCIKGGALHTIYCCLMNLECPVSVSTATEHWEQLQFCPGAAAWVMCSSEALGSSLSLHTLSVSHEMWWLLVLEHVVTFSWLQSQTNKQLTGFLHGSLTLQPCGRIFLLGSWFTFACYLNVLYCLFRYILILNCNLKNRSNI